MQERTFVDNDFFTELVYSMDVIPEYREFSFESPIYLAATNLIPRALWPGKPNAENTEFYMRLRTGRVTGDLRGNVLPGIIGQYWHVAGWLGVAAVSLWLALSAQFAGRIMLRANPSMHYVVLIFVWSAFVSFRAFAVSNFVAPIIALFTIFLTTRFRMKLRNRRPGFRAVYAGRPAQIPLEKVSALNALHR
jgi:hypothetical protein